MAAQQLLSEQPQLVSFVNQPCIGPSPQQGPIITSTPSSSMAPSHISDQDSNSQGCYYWLFIDYWFINSLFIDRLFIDHLFICHLLIDYLVIYYLVIYYLSIDYWLIIDWLVIY